MSTKEPVVPREIRDFAKSYQPPAKDAPMNKMTALSDGPNPEALAHLMDLFAAGWETMTDEDLKRNPYPFIPAAIHSNREMVQNFRNIAVLLREGAKWKQKAERFFGEGVANGIELAITREVLQEAIDSLSHARTFITSREKMHPDGVALHDDALAKLRGLQPLRSHP